MTADGELTLETQSLPVPDEVMDLPLERVAELARVWWADNQPQMMIRPAAEDPMLIGIIIADLAWHFSNAYAASGKFEQHEALSRILAGWEEGHRIRIELKAGGAQ